MMHNKDCLHLPIPQMFLKGQTRNLYTLLDSVAGPPNLGMAKKVIINAINVVKVLKLLK